jgi:MFS family permease
VSEPATPTARKATAYSYFVVGLLTLIYTFNYLDRKILSILAEPVRKDLNLSDTQLGIVTGLAFAIFYATMALPLASLADRTRRVTVVAVCCAVWSAFTALCGAATNFVQLALIRVGVATGEAGGGPPSHAIISDYFPPERRGIAMAIYTLGVPMGVIAGSAFGGWAAHLWGWRWAFVAVAAPGFVLAIALQLLVREPVRGAMDPPRPANAPPQTAATLRATLGAILRNRVFVLTAAAVWGSQPRRPI